jgi:hypothetical protein
MPDKGFDSSAPTDPRDGQNVPVVGFTENENLGVNVVLRPCPECSSSVEEGNHMDAHESWHAAQAGSGPKKLWQPSA